jgi:ubiquinone/menaquinone biosynthesis C-methylase UbiE
VGFLTDLLRVYEYKPLGVTNSPEQYRYAKEHYPATEFVLANMLHVPRSDGSFDAVQWMESIGYVNQSTAFDEAYRLLRPEGKAVVKDVAATAGVSDLVRDSWGYNFITPGELITRAEESGFTLLRSVSLTVSTERFTAFYATSKVLQALHPLDIRSGNPLAFWYEFLKT